MKHLSNTLNHFWKRWRSEYLAERRESHRHLLKKSHGTPQLSVGDVVIIREEGLPCSFWRLGCIQGLLVGRDGKTRGATVRITGKNQRLTSLNRPLQLLYPLEVDHSTDLGETSPKPPRESENQDESEEQPIRQSRPQRAAARRGEEKRKVWTRELQDEDFEQ